jgi:transposase
MVRPYSLDLRERVIVRVEAGDSCHAVAALFGVRVASVVKWSQRKCQTGSAAAWPTGGKRPVAGERDWLLALVTCRECTSCDPPSSRGSPTAPNPSDYTFRMRNGVP